MRVGEASTGLPVQRCSFTTVIMHLKCSFFSASMTCRCFPHTDTTIPQTGDDRTLIALHLTEGMSRDRLNQVFAKSKAEVTAFLGQVPGLGSDDERLHLIELAGFLETDGPTLKKVQRELGEFCLSLDTIGAYATPVSVAMTDAATTEAAIS